MRVPPEPRCRRNRPPTAEESHMQTTTMSPRTQPGVSNGHAPPGMRISPTKPRRNGALIAVGVLLMVGCGLIAAVLQMRATTKTAVLSVAHQVPAGQVVRSSDLDR